IVAGEGEVLHSAGLDRIEQSLGDTAKPEPARSDEHAVREHAVESGFGGWIKFFHAGKLPVDCGCSVKSLRPACHQTMQLLPGPEHLFRICNIGGKARNYRIRV